MGLDELWREREGGRDGEEGNQKKDMKLEGHWRREEKGGKQWLWSYVIVYVYKIEIKKLLEVNSVSLKKKDHMKSGGECGME